MPQPGRPALPAEQVLVASFSGGSPEVHVASLDAAQRVLSLQEACVSGGKVSLGSVRTVALGEVACIDTTDGVTTLLGRARQPLVQLHLESAEDQRVWSEALSAVISTAGPAVQNEEAASVPAGQNGEVARADGGDNDVHLLQARSQQLQNRIGTLEAISSRRDKQIQKMSRRLDGAMDMLSAVQDMCAQQRKVIEAQKVAITELKHECGEAPSEGQGNGTAGHGGSDAGNSSAAEDADGGSSGSGSGSGSDCDREASGRDNAAVAETEAEIVAKTQEMLRLLQQAEEMQQALRQLEGMTAAAAAQEPASPGLPAAPAPSPADADEEGAPERTGRGRARLREEAACQDSEGGHQELLQRLSDMRSLMASLGVEEDSAGSGSSDESGDMDTDGPAVTR